MTIKYHDMRKGCQSLAQPRIMITTQLLQELVNHRLMITTFNGNPETTVISCYSPKNTSEESIAEEFYSDLAKLIRDVPKHNAILVGGDMNAKIGKENCKGSHYHETTNRNG